MVTGHYENFYSSADFIVNKVFIVNEDLGYSKVAGHPLNLTQKAILEVFPRTAERMVYIIPAIHSPGLPFLDLCEVAHETPALGAGPLPGRFSTDCNREGFGINGHSALRQRNHCDTYMVIRRILEIVR